MLILGIETSCDETAAAVVEDGTKILASTVASSEEIHQKYGGIVPEQAAREQIRSIIPVIETTFKKLKPQSKIQNYQNSIEAIAVTVGPGLIGSLLVGVETAKTLAWLWHKPIVPVNHLIAHIYANFLKATNQKNQQKKVFKKDWLENKMPQNHELIFPALCLLVSGGHTELFLMKGHGQFQWLGGTRDDAAGECFDKCSRLLQLGYPGGPAIAAAAAQIQKAKIKNQNGNLKFKIILPKPMITQNNFDFSFSGLKTAVLNLVKNKKQPNPLFTKQFHNYIAFELQEAITDVLITKTLRAAESFHVKSILIGGGVAANERLREKFWLLAKNLKKIKIFLPQKKFCTDNAAVVASAAYFNYRPIKWQKIRAKPSLEIC